MPSFKTLDDLNDIAGKRVLVRVDLNVPVKDGKVTDIDPYRARRADDHRTVEEGRQGHPAGPLRPPQGRPVAGPFAVADRPLRRGGA